MPRRFIYTAIVLTTLTLTACGSDRMPMPPSSPTPPTAPTVTASAYILPDAVNAKNWAFGDEPIVIHKGERLRWVNTDTQTHAIVADDANATDFRKTGELPQGGQQSFDMTTKVGTTAIHCSIHPEMTGILIVRDN